MSTSNWWATSVRARNPFRCRHVTALLLVLLASRAVADEPAESADRVETLLKGLVEGDAKARANAASALGELGATGARTTPVLVAALHDDDPAVRTAAAAALEGVGRRGIEVIAGVLAEPGPERAKYSKAIKVILSIGAPVTAYDLAAALDVEPGSCTNLTRAAFALPALLDLRGDVAGEPPYSAYLLLLDFLQPKPSQEGRPTWPAELAAAALGVVGHGVLPLADRPIPPIVAGLLDDADPYVRWAGVRLIKRSRTTSEAARALLKKAAGDADAAVAKEAAADKTEERPAPGGARPVEVATPETLQAAMATWEQLLKEHPLQPAGLMAALRAVGGKFSLAYARRYELLASLSVRPSDEALRKAVETLAPSTDPLLAYLARRALRAGKKT